MIYYKMVKILIDVSGLVKVIINIIVRYYGLPESIIINCNLLFISKFWFLLYYFLNIKWKLSTAFYLQTGARLKGKIVL